MTNLFFNPRRHLSAQLLWRFLLVTLPVLLTGGILLSRSALSELRTQASDSLATIAADRANKIEAYARGTLRAVQLLAAQPYMPGLVAGTTPAADREAQFQFLRGTGGYRNLYLFSKEGKLVFTQDPLEAPTTELLRIIGQTRTLMSAEISDYALDQASNTPVLYVAAPIFGSGGAITGMLAARLHNEEIYRVVNDFGGLGKTGETVIAQAEGDGVVIVAPFRSLPDAAFQLRFDRGNIPASIEAAVEGVRLQSVSRNYRGREVLAVSRYLPTLGWGLVVQIDSSEIFAPAINLLWGMVIGGGVLVLLLVFGAHAAGLALRRPLRSLTNAARQIEEGDFSARARLDDRNDEFGYLGRAFDSMAKQVQVATENLRETNALLEQKVADRTKDLQVKTVEAERANHAKSEFLANMSHELRTPLNGILGYAQILQILPDLPPKVTSGLRVIRQSGEHLLTLINDILDLAKIEARTIELVPVDFQLREFLRSPIDMFEIRAQQKGIAFEVELAPDLPQVIRADEKRLRQVVINLLGNAVKFTEKGSVRFEVTMHGQKMRFAFKDTGIGIAPGKIAQLFKSFSQVADASRNADGTGLGLALSQRLVQLMGGKIEVVSDFGKGSTFSFELTFAEASPGLLRETVHESPAWITGYAGPRRKVLVVDDNETNRHVLVEMLRPLGFEVSEAADGQVALEVLQKERPHLVFTDIAMPVIDGVQFIQYARQMTAFQDLPIIPVSASVGELELSRCRTLGCDDFLFKPVEYARLLECVRRRLNLEWTGERQSATKEESSLADAPKVFLSSDDASRFLDLARRGDLMGLVAAAEQLATAQPTYQLFLTQLRKLCESFRVRDIRRLIEDHTPSP